MTALQDHLQLVLETGSYLTIQRTDEEVSGDGPNQGFTILIGRPEGQSVLTVTASVSNDGSTAEVSVTAYTDGEPDFPTITDLGETQLISHAI